jgi:hypothetical protein
VGACFGPFSAQLAKVGPYRTLEKEAQDLIGALHEKLERRRRDLQTGLGVSVRSKIKLTTVELKVCYIVFFTKIGVHFHNFPCHAVLIC